MKIKITFPDRTKKEYEQGITPAQIAAGISERLGREALAAYVNNKLVDLDTPIKEDSEIKIITFDDDEGKQVFWHSSAHVLAQAVKRLFPKAKPTIGPSLKEGGFYYDFADLNITQDDLKRIEDEMKKISRENLATRRIELSYEQAKKIFADNPYKIELIEEHKDNLSSYKQGEFEDLCRGPHIPRTGLIKAVWINKIAGAYWRADSDNKQLTRIYGITFPDKKKLSAYKRFLEEAKKRDHRLLASQMELYTTSEDIGPGLILWLPKGNVIKEELEKWVKETEEKQGYKRVTTPIITKEGLFYTSEHLPHYADSMFKPMSIDSENYYIKPMNCPFHHKIFSSKTRSYKELPLRLAEYGWCHRYEQSGALFGLMRVRGMQMNDAHIYCTYEQAIEEFLNVMKLHEYYFEKLGITEYWMELSLRDPDSDKYHGDESMWQEAEALMREAMDNSKIPYKEDIGGAAFYGPKMDFQVKSAIGREFTMSTNQIDLFMPKKFGLKYMDESGEEKTPVCIHRAPLGTHERTIGFLIEHFAGKFPLWLAPEQVAVLPISAEHITAADNLFCELKASGFRVILKAEGQTLNKRIRDCQIARIPAIIIIGDKEVDNNTVALRTLNGKTEYGIKKDDFLKRMIRARDDRSLNF